MEDSGSRWEALGLATGSDGNLRSDHALFLPLESKASFIDLGEANDFAGWVSLCRAIQLLWRAILQDKTGQDPFLSLSGLDELWIGCEGL
jgi:hypothetical protein